MVCQPIACNNEGVLNPIPYGCNTAEILQPAQCPLASEVSIGSEILCDLVPSFNSPLEFLANLPIVLLFVFSAPARFLYCLLYSVTLEYAQIVQFIFQLLISIEDFFLNPVFSAIEGFLQGAEGDSYNPSVVDNSAVIPYTCLFETPIGSALNVIDEVTYTIGYIFGYLYHLLVLLYDELLFLICYLVNLGFQVCVSVGFDVDGIKFGSCNCTPCFQPFGFLAGFVESIINCNCVLQQTPCLQYTVVVGNYNACQTQNNAGYTCNTNPSEAGTNVVPQPYGTNPPSPIYVPPYPTPTPPPPQSSEPNVSESETTQSEINSEASEISSEIISEWSEHLRYTSERCHCYYVCSSECDVTCNSECSNYPQFQFNCTNNYCDNLLKLLNGLSQRCYQNCQYVCTSECYENCQEECG